MIALVFYTNSCYLWPDFPIKTGPENEQRCTSLPQISEKPLDKDFHWRRATK